MPKKVLKNRPLIAGFIITLNLCTVTVPTSAVPKQNALIAPRASTTCVRLARDMIGLSKMLALNYAEGIGDDSARHATLRETQYQSLLSRVRMNMDLMRDNRCKLPKSVPTGQEYVDDAISCRSQILKTGREINDGSCDQSKWSPKY